LAPLGVFARITEIRTGSTSGARLAQGIKSEALYLEPKQSFGQSSLTRQFTNSRELLAFAARRALTCRRKDASN